MAESFELERFVEAQRGEYRTVLEELKAGRKDSHWMWYIFPQIQGLGRSDTSLYYAISSQAEARAYLEHAVLGGRLRECTQLVLEIEDRDVRDIFPWPDHLKFHSCMTLFELSASPPSVFRAAIQRYFGGVPDKKTVDILGLR